MKGRPVHLKRAATAGLQPLLIFLFSFLVLSPALTAPSAAEKLCGKRSVQEQEREKDKPNNDGQKQGGPVQRTASALLSDHPTRLFGQPATVNVLPIVYYDFRTGLNVGMRTVVHSRQATPYLYKLRIQVLASSKGSHKHKLLFDYPQIGSSGFGLRLVAAWYRDLRAHYYGLGNDSRRDRALVDKESDEFVHEDYYLYNFLRPRVAIYSVRRVVSEVLFWFGMGIEKARPQFKSGRVTSYLGQDRPFGVLGGTGRFFSFRLTWDTRNDDLFPHRGFLTEVSVEPNFATVDAEVEGPEGVARVTREVAFQRFTFSDARFLRLKSDRLILANRIAFEAVTGDAPYYAFGEIVGQRLTRAVGGSQSLRGFKSRRFQDKIKLITLTELRFNAHRLRVLSNSFDLILVAFMDTGRVWHGFSELSARGLHATFGFGTWLNWNQNMILRLDVGHSAEGWTPYFRLSSAF